MTLPTVPTDNLYKFSAISGLLILGFSFYFPLSTISELELKEVASRTKLSVLEFESSLLARDIDLAESKIKSISAEEIAQLKDRASKNKLKAIEIRGERDRQTTLAKQLGRALNVLQYGAVIGASLSFFGFACWYFKVQRPADKLIKSQVQKAAQTPH